MKDINFLPDSFLRRQRKSRDHVFFGSIAIATGCVILSVSVLMTTIRQSVAHQSQALDLKITSARETQNELAKLKLQLASQNEQAVLLSYVDQEWPVSRILAEIAEPMPSQIVLLQMSYNRDSAKNPNVGNPFDQAKTAEAEASTVSQFAADLKTLREITEKSPWVITIEGETTDAAVLHLFVDKLNSSPMFDAVALEGFHASGSVDERTRQFTLRLSVAPGHAQTNGKRFKSSLPAGKADMAGVIL